MCDPVEPCGGGGGCTHISCIICARRIVACLQAWQKMLVEIGFQELIFEDAMGLLLQQVRAALLEYD